MQAKDMVAKDNRPTGIDDMFEVGVDEMRKLRTDELVIGLCGPIGSPLHKVAGTFKELLEQRYGYECTIVKLSAVIEEMRGPVTAAKRFDRIQKLIEAGNELRRNFGASVLADMTIGKIAMEREGAKKSANESRYTNRRRCYIVDSIKNNNELEILRLVYRDMFHFVGVFAPLHVRQAELEAGGMTLPEVYQLIDRDSGEEFEHGQTVRETFPRADFFVRAGIETSDMRERIERLLDLILRTKVITPTIAETAMYPGGLSSRKLRVPFSAGRCRNYRWCWRNVGDWLERRAEVWRRVVQELINRRRQALL